jgi:Na+/H+ antiporter NhaD/arsenite permease-like protein
VICLAIGDWNLLILFIGLFVVNHALAQTGVTEHAVAALEASGVPLSEPAPFFAAALVLSNVVSNVPAATEPFGGPMLALDRRLDR